MTPEDREEIKRHFGVVAEGLRSDIRLLADGVAANTDRLGSVEDRLSVVEDRLGVVEADLRDLRGEVRHGFVELRSMVKLSYSELDRRLSTLEDGYGDLKVRMERVEAKVAS